MVERNNNKRIIIEVETEDDEVIEKIIKDLDILQWRKEKITIIILDKNFRYEIIK